MQRNFKTGLVSSLSAIILAAAGISVASAESTSAPYRPQASAANTGAKKAGNCGYEDPMRGYRSSAPRYERERYAPPRSYPRYRSRPSYRDDGYRRAPRRDSWDGMPWGGSDRGFNFGSGNTPWGGSRRGRSKGFSFGSDDFKPWDDRRRGRSRGFGFGGDDFSPW